ncbi:MAG: hypothetical protein R3179_06670, partial [Sedimenticolaceae bacterium]|nr:hypothetical protein [Sedimenticolaceae bacterium]
CPRIAAPAVRYRQVNRWSPSVEKARKTIRKGYSTADSMRRGGSPRRTQRTRSEFLRLRLISFGRVRDLAKMKVNDYSLSSLPVPGNFVTSAFFVVEVFQTCEKLKRIEKQCAKEAAPPLRCEEGVNHKGHKEHEVKKAWAIALSDKL